MELQVRTPEPRPCIVNGNKRALLHFFFIRAWTHGESAMIGGFTAGQEAHPSALVEYEDGSMDTLEPQRVRMLDSAGLFAEYCFVEEGERGEGDPMVTDQERRELARRANEHRKKASRDRWFARRYGDPYSEVMAEKHERKAFELERAAMELVGGSENGD